jgi:hypothetical protein
MAMPVVMAIMMAVLMMSILVMAVLMMPVAIMAVLGVMLAVVAFRSSPTGVHALTVVPVHAMMVMPMMAVAPVRRRMLAVMTVMAFTMISTAVMTVTTVSSEVLAMVAVMTLAMMTFAVMTVMAFAMISTAVMAMTTVSSEVLAVVAVMTFAVMTFAVATFAVMTFAVMTAAFHLAEGAMTFMLAACMRVVTAVGVHLVSVAMRAAGGFRSTGHRVRPGAAKGAAAVAGKILHESGVQLAGFFRADDAFHDFAHLVHPVGIEEMSRTRRRRMMAFARVMPIVLRAAVGLSIGAVMIAGTTVAGTAITRTGVAGATIAGRRGRRPFAVALAGSWSRLLVGRANLGNRRGCLCKPRFQVSDLCLQLLQLVLELLHFALARVVVTSGRLSQTRPASDQRRGQGHHPQNPRHAMSP